MYLNMYITCIYSTMYIITCIQYHTGNTFWIIWFFNGDAHLTDWTFWSSGDQMSFKEFTKVTPTWLTEPSGRHGIKWVLKNYHGNAHLTDWTFWSAEDQMYHGDAHLTDLRLWSSRRSSLGEESKHGDGHSTDRRFWSAGDQISYEKSITVITCGCPHDWPTILIHRVSN